VTAAPTLQTFSVEYERRPWTTNGERKGNRWTRSQQTREWRTVFATLARLQRVPALAWCTVTVEAFQKGGRLQDTVGCSPAFKAALDGIVDAGVLPDDSPEFVHAVTFLPPQRGRNALRVTLTGPVAD